MTRFAAGVNGGGAMRGRTSTVLSCVGCDKPFRRFKVPTVAVCRFCRGAFQVNVYRYCREVLGVAEFDYWTYRDRAHAMRDSAAGIRAVVVWARERVAA